ncbi:putative E3 ubiquitin-protein ligase [Forsythia ovata]|uniref:E3 ubiquitin-protein ligase n=1 Tax=Forsythia ovata TaxID=205694 RepID=A0ABD1W4D3_9LAMI
MGTVSTALPKEILSKCLGRSIYQAIPSEVLVTESDKDEDHIKCSICQDDKIDARSAAGVCLWGRDMEVCKMPARDLDTKIDVMCAIKSSLLNLLSLSILNEQVSRGILTVIMVSISSSRRTIALASSRVKPQCLEQQQQHP